MKFRACWAGVVNPSEDTVRVRERFAYGHLHCAICDRMGCHDPDRVDPIMPVLEMLEQQIRHDSKFVIGLGAAEKRQSLRVSVLAFCHQRVDEAAKVAEHLRQVQRHMVLELLVQYTKNAC